jgi:hypothetical protein
MTSQRGEEGTRAQLRGVRRGGIAGAGAHTATGSRAMEESLGAGDGYRGGTQESEDVLQKQPKCRFCVGGKMGCWGKSFPSEARQESAHLATLTDYFQRNALIIFPKQGHSLMKDNHSLHNIPTRNKRRLSWLDHPMSHRGKPVSQHLGEDLEAHIKKTDRPILLNTNHFSALQ